MSEKTRRAFHIVCACVAILAAVVAFFLTPMGRRIVGEKKVTAEQVDSSSEEAVQNAVTTESQTMQSGENAANSVATAEYSVTVPTPTEPTTNPYKNYTLFIDKKTFDYTEVQGVTTLVAKDNKNVKMTITPIKNQSYGEYCAELLDNYGSMGESERLNIVNTNSAFQSKTGNKDSDIITTVYCVDDGKGGCIEIKYQTPVSAKAYAKTFQGLLTMFKVL